MGQRNPDLSPQDIDRFWSHVERGEPDECWPWTGTLTSGGPGKNHGNFPVAGRTVKAHRLAYELAHGPIAPALVVCHTCDNPPCCNGAHLFADSVAGNNADRHAKGRSRGLFQPGPAHPRFKVTVDAATEMRTMRADGATQQAIADRFGVSRGHVAHIVSGVLAPYSQGVA